MYFKLSYGGLIYMRKKLITILTPIFFILLFTSTSTLTLAATAARDWAVDDEIVFGIYEKTDVVEINKELGLKGGGEYIYKAEAQFTILSIDESLKEVLINKTYNDGYSRTSNYDYDGMDMAQSVITPYYLLDVNYIYDLETDQVLLRSLDCYLFPWWVIEVDWTEFNNHFKGVFNDTNIIDYIYPPSGTEEITVAEFLNSISYTICGRNNIVNARNQFTATRTKWVMSFDLSGVAHFYDYEKEEYALYNKYKVSSHIEYTASGTLKKYQFIKEYKYETETREVDYYSEITKRLGGVRKLPIPVGFLAVGFSVVAIAIIRIRKKNVC